MTGKTGGLGLIALLLAVSAGFAQSPELLPPPRPAAAQVSEPLLPIPLVCPDGFPLDLTPPQEDGVLYPCGQKVGWFGGFAVGLVKPHINAHVSSGAALNPAFAGPVQLPVAPLSWTGMPAFDLGYRFAHGAGELLASYRLLASEGTSTLPAFDLAGAGELKTRLNVNRFNFAYVNHEFLLDRTPNLFRDIFGGVGLSAGNVFFDSQAHGAQILSERASNNFAGVGPYLTFGLDKSCGPTPFAWYGRLEAAGLIGKTRQHFEETDVTPAGVVSAASASGSQSNGVGLFGVESGFQYVPGQSPVRLSVGYRWERWWFVGATDTSNADLTIQGFFLRGEIFY